ncbi:phage portal protein [Agromyces ramosus]|uniref:A118 family predicted phage portal protein n=1 Tax=Agromyces ramosus TaxID=33879 RepID=A0ABU0R8N5_9MICO|nr:phage portal protein [Agromyces ramosus]MDQ0894437.1 A118 family predicted phage portal protein [Agromyces ramosus]
MPLPLPNTAWPPAPWDYAYRVYAENEAWYLGDTDALERIYRREEQRTRPDYVRNGQPMRGGIVGAATRMFWGRPVPAGQSRTRIHIPAPADLATLSSDLLFSEPPEVKLTEENVAEKTKSRLDLIANSDDVHAMFNQMGELKAALGAAVLTTVWDTDVADHVWLEASAADVIIPEFRKGKLIACTMWTEYRQDNVFWRHLERHEIGSIEHALYEGTETNIGRRVPLTERTETEYLAKVINADSVIETGIDRLTVSYNPNMPTRAWRKKGELAYTGRSDFAELHPLFDALDETWSSWMRDLKLGAGKILVPESVLQSLGPGAGSYFDAGQEAFVGLNAPGDPDKMKLDQVQFAIRVDDHEKTAHAIYREILRAAGYSQSAWGDYGSEKQQTATEVEDRDKASERTRDKKALYDKQAISRQVSVALELDGKLFPGKGGGRFELPIVEFPDVSQEDPEKLARTLSLLDAAGAISTEQKVRRANPDWDDEQVDVEVAKIRSEEQDDSLADPRMPPFDENPGDDEDGDNPEA